MEAARADGIRRAAASFKAGNVTIKQAADAYSVTSHEVETYLDRGEAWLEPQLPAFQPERREKGPASKP